MKRTSTAGITRQSHKSRKTTPTEPVKPETSTRASASGPSSAALATTPPPASLNSGLQNPPKEEDSAQSVATGVPQVEPKKQWWYRPPDSPARKLAEKILVMRAAGHRDAAIAKRLKTTPGTVQQYVYVARKNGWLDKDDEPVDIEAEYAMTIDRKIVRNVDAALDGHMTNWQTHEMTLAAAKGRGHFKNYDKVEGGDTTLPVVAIQVIMPPIGEADQCIIEANVGGVPAYCDGEITDVDTGQISEAGHTSTGPQETVAIEP